MYGEKDIDMKVINNIVNPYGLRAKLGIALVKSAIVSILLFTVLNSCIELLISNCVESFNFEDTFNQKLYDKLQDFIDDNSISSHNLSNLKKWEKKQPIILLELYENERCIYSSIYDAPVSSLVLDDNKYLNKSYTINLTDKAVLAFIYSDFTYELSVILTIISILLSFVIFILLFFYNIKKLLLYICRLNEEIQILEGGNLEYCVTEEGNDEITDLAKSMNRMRTTLQQQIETEKKLYQANRQLITEMSHDLRTPLTGIMLYLEILRTHRYETEEQLQDYLKKIDTKAHNMKLLSDHLFEYSMQEVTEKQIPIQTMEQAFIHEVKNLIEDLKARGFCVDSDLQWSNYYVQLNPEFIQRIFANIVSNIDKYGEKNAIVRIDTIAYENYCGISIINSFSSTPSQVESNGVGIESIRSMMKQMNGICNVEQTDSTFEITLSFPIK